jgi:NAD(P)H-dependent FMN reductase
MKKLLAFSGSISQDSINHRLVEYASGLASIFEVKIIRLSDFEAPYYRKEIEASSGIPEKIKELRALFDEADGFILSTPEYNSSIPAGLKNTLDWISRMEGKIFQDKPVLLMATSPGGRGGQSVLGHLSSIMPFWGATVIGPFSLPRFGDNFEDGRIIDPELDDQLKGLVKELELAIR